MRRRFVIISVSVGILVLVCIWFFMTRLETVWGRHRIFDRLDALRERAASEPADSKALQQLIDSLNSRSSFERTHAAIQLGRLGPKGARAVGPLLKVAQGKDEFAAWPAARSLGEIGPAAKEAVPTLLRFIKEQPDSSIGWGSAEAVGKIADPNDAEVLRVLEDAQRADDPMAASARMGLEAMRKRPGSGATTGEAPISR
jgi:HEAT repeat protein